MAARYSPACNSIRLIRWPRPSARSSAAELAADVEQRGRRDLNSLTNRSASRLARVSPADAKPGTKPGTRQRILRIAGELFARQGYTATTIADIARELGTTTAALYYHFPSKAAILGGLLAGPLTAYTKLLDGLDSGEAAPEDLLGAIVDITADSRDLATIFDRDPAALSIIDEQLPRPSREMTEQTIRALAGPDPDRAALIRANAALAAAKAAALAALELGGGVLDAADRAEVLALALRTLEN
jgi:AcrR family transcriptional regulator